VTEGSPGSSGEPARVDATVGKYRLDHLIGAGGMGLVWAAFDPDLERPVALKLLRVESAEQTMRTRLLREARAMAKLRHPNVVTVFEVGTDKGRDYIAMELVEGGTLDEWLQTKPARTQIIAALVAAGRGLAAAHAAGVVHRDFKPHNVLRGKDEHIYVTDFGLARGQIEEGPEIVTMALPVTESTSRRLRDEILDSPLTQTGVLIGTPAYMAPEQFTGGVPDPKSDQFAFCVTAWQALTGERPFRGKSVAELEAAVKTGAGKLVADLTPPMRAVLERGLDPEPGRRWPSMEALLEALVAADKPAKRRWVLPMLAGLAVAAAGTTVALVVASGDDDDELCEPAEHAFANAWGPERRAQFKKNGFEHLGSFAILDEIRRNWIRTYSEACAAPRTAETKERIMCLLASRDEIAKALDRRGIDIGEIAQLAAGVVLCDPSSIRTRFGREPPIPPMPPPVER
jgi:tRNA A-37 threonylcarbamoyl transferase component Bud32